MQNSNDKNRKCPHCNASMIVHKERVSKGLVRSLIKLKQAVLKLDRNKIHLDEIGMNQKEYNNFQKLRYHGLVAKFVDPDTKKNVSGYWLLTRRGNQFLKNTLAVPGAVYTFRNKIIDKDVIKFTIAEILENNDVPTWDERLDFPFDFADLMDIEEIKTDANGQALINLFI